jgi:hypothetical protein
LGKPHEFAKVDIGNTGVASNDEHVLVIICSGGFTEVCRPGYD